MKKQDGGEFVELDPAVRALVDQGVRRQEEQRLPVKERQARAKAKARTAARSRVVLDLPESMTAWIKGEAERLHVTASQVAVVLLAEGIGRVVNGVIDLEGRRVINQRSRRYDYSLPIPPQWDTPINVKGHPIKK